MKLKPLILSVISVCISALVALLFFPGSALAKSCTLRIIGWEGYMDSSFTQPFEQQFGCKIVSTYAGSSDEMYAKIKASKGRTYDLVTASGDLTKRLYDANLVEPIDLNQVLNYKDLFPIFQKPAYNTFNAQAYGVSIAWGPDFLIYDKSVVKTEPKTWNILYDPAYKGKVCLPDYPIFNADIALWHGDSNIYQLSKDKLTQEIKPNLLRLRPQVRKFWNSQGELAQLFLNKEVTLAWGWPVAIEELKRADFPIAATIPKEGTTGWSDSWMLLKGSQNQEIAYAWMNYMLTGSAQKSMTEVTGYWPVSQQVLPLLTKEQRQDFHLEEIETYYSQIHFWETVPNYDDWVAVWNEFRGQ